MLFGCCIGWICGFTGSGGGILMLTVVKMCIRDRYKTDKPSLFIKAICNPVNIITKVNIFTILL